jgi:hypothetical protein
VGTALNVRATIQNLAGHDKVRFELDGAVVRTEGGEPYALGGDDGNGDYFSWTPSVGSHSLKVIVLDANEAELSQRIISFSVTGAGALFDRARGDLISLHYDHMPDPDDGHATVAARTVTGYYRITPHVVAGTHSFPVSRENAFPEPFQEAAMTVMSAAWGGAWLNAHDYSGNNDAPNAQTVQSTATKWHSTLQNGGHVWIAEGGPSDFTAFVLHYMQDHLNYQFQTPRRIHVIQHGAEPCSNPNYYRLNERYTGEENLLYVQNNTDYRILGNGNCNQVSTGNDKYIPIFAPKTPP